MEYSSAILEYFGTQGDSFWLSWECRRYFANPEKDVLEYVVSAKYYDVYQNFQDPNAATDKHCTIRGLNIGKS